MNKNQIIQKIKDINTSINIQEQNKQNLLDKLCDNNGLILHNNIWVIDKSANMYFQVAHFSGESVAISRKGNVEYLSIYDYYRRFRLADASEVRQHIKFLREKGYEFIIPKITDVSGSMRETQKPISEPIPPSDDFYMVTLKGGFGSKVYHKTHEIALKEATRLAAQEKKEAFVLGVVSSVKAKEVVSYEAEVRDWRNNIKR